jgi:quinol monooxygenase YgiN
MVIVTGHLIVAAGARDAYLDGCRTVVEQARSAPGCLDFALSPDLLDPGRINILERWESPESVEAFRGSGVSAEQAAEIRTARVDEYDVAGERRLS